MLYYLYQLKHLSHPLTQIQSSFIPNASHSEQGIGSSNCKHLPFLQQQEHVIQTGFLGLDVSIYGVHPSSLLSHCEFVHIGLTSVGFIRLGRRIRFTITTKAICYRNTGVPKLRTIFGNTTIS